MTGSQIYIAPHAYPSFLELFFCLLFFLTFFLAKHIVGDNEMAGGISDGFLFLMELLGLGLVFISSPSSTPAFLFGLFIFDFSNWVGGMGIR